MKTTRLKLVERTDMRPVASPGRKLNKTYRTREHLTESEMTKLLAALKANRHGHRDWLIGLLIYRHGLRVSEACDLRWDESACNAKGPRPPMCSSTSVDSLRTHGHRPHD